MNDDNIYFRKGEYLYGKNKKEAFVLCKRGDLRLVGDKEVDGKLFTKYLIAKTLKSFKGGFEYLYKKQSYVGKYIYVEK